MSQAFDGRWVDGEGTEITVTSQDDFLTVQYGNGRGPFQGIAVTVGFSVIYVSYTDTGLAWTGVLTADRAGENTGKILWNNETVWRRI